MQRHSTLSVAPNGIRPRLLAREHLPQVERFFVSLDVADRRGRFHHAVSDWWLGAYVQNLDPARVILVGGFCGAQLLGVAEAHPAGSAPVVEMAVAVHPAHRRAGLATRLVDLALTYAFARGAQCAEFAYSPDNEALTGLLNAFDARTNGNGQALIDRARFQLTQREAA